MKPLFWGSLLAVLVCAGYFYYVTTGGSRGDFTTVVFGSTRPARPGPKAEDFATAIQRARANQKNPEIAATARGSQTAEEKVKELKDILGSLPDQAIPELLLLSESDWFVAADRTLETPEDYRAAFASLRAGAEKKFARILLPALQHYAKDHQGKFPATIAELDLANKQLPRDLNLGPQQLPNQQMFDRYEIRPASEFGRVQVGGDRVYTQVALKDSQYDSRIIIGRFGYAVVGPSRP